MEERIPKMGISIYPSEVSTSYNSHNGEPPIHQDTLIAMVVNPHTLFVYWDTTLITQSLVAQHFMTAWADIRLGLRVWDVTGVAIDAQFAVAHAQGQRDEAPASSTAPPQTYLQGLRSGRDYIVDLGTWTADQHFFTILRSNSVHTPRTLLDESLEANDTWKPANPMVINWKSRFTGYSLGG